MPKLVYLDHGLVAHDPSWPAIERLFHDPGYRLGLSMWNLLEIAAASDLAQRKRRIAFLESLKPVWLLDHVYVRKQEIRRFPWPRRFNTPSPDLLFAAPHLSQAEAVYAGASARIGVAIETVVAGLAHIDITQHKKLSPRALAFLQNVPKHDWKKRQREVFGAVMTGVIPDVDPTGRALLRAQQLELINYCWANRPDFMAACPTIAVDDALCEARISDPKRKSQESDGIDLAHAVMALGYCDHFIVRDGFVASCARQAEKRLSGLAIARVVANPAQVR